MNREGLEYLAKNTGITYFGAGSIAKALVETNNREIMRLSQFIGDVFQNSFVSSANGLYLDLIGESLGLPRRTPSPGFASRNDKVVRFYSREGTLGAKLPDPADRTRGLIPAGVEITNPARSVSYLTVEPTYFPINAKSAFVAVQAETTGTRSSVGANQLTAHDLSIDGVLVTNDRAITSGSDLESDEDYRYRLSRFFSARFGSNSAAIQLATLGQPGVSRVEIDEFARGAGTFDLLVIPSGNTVPLYTLDLIRSSVDSVKAVGVSAVIKEPTYVPFKISVEIIPSNGVSPGQIASGKSSAQSAILDYFGSIPIGGEMVINQLRAAIITSSAAIKDLRIVEFCVRGRPRLVQNFVLGPQEMFIPDELSDDPVVVYS
jgi:uncharacterized phage protein gp47/JayE